jgi:hypothetical protein
MTPDAERMCIRSDKPQHWGDEFLTQKEKDVLSGLALSSEECTDLAEALARTEHRLAQVIERHAEFDGPSRRLREKLSQLRRLSQNLGQKVMHYSHLCEDALNLAGLAGRR